MASVAGRKKSIISSSGLQIDTPVANNTLLNQAATSSLYQECSRLRSRLMTIHGFQQYFTLCSSQSTDHVSNLWDLFSNGIPLCYLFDLLPEGFVKINLSEFNQDMFDTNPDRAKKHAIAMFAMQIRSDKVKEYIPGCELFTVTDLWDRSSNDGLVKVIKTVSALVDALPPSAFEEVESYDQLTGTTSVSVTGREAARNNIIREMVDTERKYVQDLEIMQKYATALSHGGELKQDTIHLLFPGLNRLLNFQRKFLIKFESTAELPWEAQRWGQLFLDSEDEFVVYEPYCGNYTMASELMLVHEEALSAYNHLLNVKGELPAFLIKPVQRICKYPLLLDQLIKSSSPESYPHFEELKAGSVTAKRITDKINEAQRQAENELTVKHLQHRVDDWKGHHLENFGRLLLDAVFTVTKSDIDREYHVFLFEKIILCCKEALPAPPNGKKVSKANSLKKQSLASPGGLGQGSNKNTPLLLKGRIFLGNVTQAVPSSPRNSVSSSITHYPLSVWWRGDDDLEFFTLRCRREDQMRQWETTINRLIKEAAQRRVNERSMSRAANSTNPAQGRLTSSTVGYRTPPYSGQPFDTRSRGDSVYRDEYSQFSAVPSTANASAGPLGYPNGFEEGDEDEFEDYPNTTGYASGRGTPIGGPRRTISSMPPEREHMGGPDRPRALTESGDGPTMAQWRNNSNGPYNNTTLRPNSSRVQSNMSAASYASEASFGNGIPPRSRPTLRSQFSSTRLRTNENIGENRPGLPAGVTPKLPLPTPPIAQTPNPPMGSRSRSASQPSAYIPRALPPPLPQPGNWNSTSQTNLPQENGNNKRGSGSSQSTGDSSDYSPNSSSPITPFGSSESSLGGIGLRSSRSQNFENAVNGNGHAPPVKVKVHFHEDIFVIQVPRATEYSDLVEKVGRKIRLCGPRRDDGPLRVKYRDEDGDMVSLGSTEDVQMAFEQFRPGGQVTLFVT